VHASTMELLVATFVLFGTVLITSFFFRSRWQMIDCAFSIVLGAYWTFQPSSLLLLLADLQNPDPVHLLLARSFGIQMLGFALYAHLNRKSEARLLAICRLVINSALLVAQGLTLISPEDDIQKTRWTAAQTFLGMGFYAVWTIGSALCLDSSTSFPTIPAYCEKQP